MAVRMHGDNSVIIITQSGRGIPTHLSPKATLFFDIDAAVGYINKDGLNTWASLIDSSMISGTSFGRDVFVTGGTYANGTATYTNNTGGTFSVSGFKNNDIYVTGGSYNNITGIATFTNNTGGTFNVFGFNIGTGTSSSSSIVSYTYNSSNNTFTITDSTGNTFNAAFTRVSGLTVTNGLSATTISATTFFGDGSNLTGLRDIYVTGGTYSNGTTTFRNNTGGTFSVTGYYTGATDVFVTGGTYTAGTILFRNNTGGTFSVTNLFSGTTDVYVTGGTYGNGVILFRNNTGGTFSVTNLFSGATDVFVTGGTYSNGTATFRNNTGGTFSISGFSTGNTTASATTLYTGDGILQNNRVVNLSSFTLNFSSDTQPNTLVLSGGKIGVGVNPISGAKLDIFGDVVISSTTLNRTTKINNDGIYFSRSSDGSYVSSVIADGSMTFDTRNNFNWVSNGGVIGRFYETGNLMINQPSDSGYKLDVGGTVRVSGVAGTSLYVGDGTQKYNGLSPVIINNGPYNLRLGFESNGFYGLIYGDSGIVLSGQSGGSIRFIPSSFITEYDTKNFKSTNSALTFNAGHNGAIAFETYATTTRFSAITAVYVDNNNWGVRFNSMSGGVTSEAMRIFNSNLLLGNTTDSGYKLDVRGTTRLSATTNPLTLLGLQSASDSNILTVDGSGVVHTISVSSVSGNSRDVFVTGGTYTAGTATFRNNTGGTFSVTGFSTSSGGSGASITAFTYNNNNVFSITESSANTFTALINTVSGFTINGNLTVTGNTNIRALSATTGQFSGTGNVLLVKGASSDILTINDSVSGTLFTVATLADVTQFSVTTGGTRLHTFLYDSANSSGSTNQVLASTAAGVVWTNQTGGGGGSGASITAFTYNNNNVFSITESSANTFTALINTVSGFTINGNLTVTGNTNIRALSATTGQFSGTGNVLLVKGASSDILTINDSISGTLFTVATTADITQFSVTTGGTRLHTFLYDSANSSGSTNQVLSSTPSGVVWTNQTGGGGSGASITAFTYNNNNVFSITESSGATFNALINTVSGFTINGNLTVTGNTNIRALSATTGQFSGTGNVLLVKGALNDIITVSDNVSSTLFSVGTTGGTTHFSVTTGGTRLHTFLYDSANSSGSTNQVLASTAAGVVWINQSGGTSGIDVFVTGGTYPNGVILFRNNTGGTFTVTNLFSGTTDVFVTGGTYNSGVILFRNNTGGTFTVTNLFSGVTDVYVTGGTYTAGTILFRNNTGGTFSVTNLFSGTTDVFVTGGTYNNITGAATFTNNTGGTFSVFGFNSNSGTSSSIVSYTYNSSNNTFTITDSTGQTFNAAFTRVSGLTVTNGLSATTISATTFFGDGSNLTGLRDIYVTGGTYTAGTATFRNNTGGTFTVTNLFSGTTDVYVTGGTYSNGVIVFRNNTGGTFTVTNLFSGTSNIISGAGVINYIPKFSGTTGITISTIFDDGTNIGINTTTPFNGATARNSIELSGGSSNITVGDFAVLGKLQSNGYGAVGSNFYLDTTILRRKNADTFSAIDFSAGGFLFKSDGSSTANSTITPNTLMQVLANGNVQIGTTTDSGYKLDVRGTTRLSGGTTITASTNPLTLLGLQSASDSNILTVDANGVVHTILSSSITATTASATTLYTSDGTLQSNRVVNLSSFTLNFSSATQPNTLILSGGSVGIGVVRPAYKFDVNGSSAFKGQALFSAATDPIKVTGLQSASDSNVMTVDGSGVVHTMALSTITGGSSSFRFISICTATTTSGSSVLVNYFPTFVEGGSLEISASGVDANGSDYIIGKGIIRYYRDTGGSLSVGTYSNILATERSGGFGAVAFGVDASGSALRIILTGLDSHTIFWCIEYKIVNSIGAV